MEITTMPESDDRLAQGLEMLKQITAHSGEQVVQGL
jgi:hypothetical protein